MKNLLITAILFLFIMPLLPAQEVSRAEYFFDSDPGFGNGTKTAFTPADSITLTQNIIVPGNLAGGLHNLYVRVQDQEGTWSMPEIYHIFV